MGWLKSLFGNKKEIDTVYVELGKLSLWFDEKTEPLLENIKDDIQAKFNEIRINCERARESSRALANTMLRNDKIPERAIQVMQGNREAYIKSVNLFLDQIKTPSSINMGLINDFLSRFEENLNYFTKTSSRSYYVLQEFFRDESGAIAQYIKKVDFLARSIFDNDYRKINAVSQKIEEIDSFLALRKKAGDLIEEEKTNYSSINAMKKETMDKMEKLEQSRDYRELQELGKEKDRISKEIRDNEAELISLFSPIEKSMKKYEKITLYGAGILRDYIDSPLHGLMKDDGLNITEVLAKMREAVESNQLDLNDKKKERTIEALGMISKERLQQIAKKHYEHVDSMEKLKRREGINTAAQKLNELNYKLSHLDNQLERSRSTIEKISKQMERTDIKKMISEIENDVEDLLSVRLRVRWHDETAQKPA
ncbi:MAG TPA: hypothetical protein VJC00_01440 [Candidatus Nanoarchaeia archaeon]|nr:hypothetical protein [Candidatus Nanoarchaeia archaeon]